MGAYDESRAVGSAGLGRGVGYAGLNGNYLRVRMGDIGFASAFDRLCMHEFVAQPPSGVRTLDVAKALLDHGVHPMTVYFPLVVKEAMMVEPTETEALETLDAYALVLKTVLERAAEDPDYLAGAPYHTPVRRLDEVRAARQPVLSYAFDESA